jgi:hypothetical protein
MYRVKAFSGHLYCSRSRITMELSPGIFELVCLYSNLISMMNSDQRSNSEVGRDKEDGPVARRV